MNGPTFAQPAPAHAAPPRPPAPRPAAKPDPDAGNGLRVFTYLRLHWLLIAFCGTLLGAAGSYAAWELLPSKYESYSLLQVSSAPSSLASGSNRDQNRTDFATYVKTTAALIKSEFVLNAALRDLKDLPTIKEQKDPIKYLDDEVQVSWQDGSEIVRISFKGHNPGDVKRVVDSVQAAFLKEVVQKEVLVKRALVAKTEDARNKIEKMLADRTKKPAMNGLVPVAAAVPAGAPNLLPPFEAKPPAVGPVVPNLQNDDLIMRLRPGAVIDQFVALDMGVRQLPIDIQIARRNLLEAEGKIKALKEAPIPQETIAEAEKDPAVFQQGRARTLARTRYENAVELGNPMAPEVVNMRKVWEAQEKVYEDLHHEKARQLEQAKRKVLMEKLAAEWTAGKHQVEKLEAKLGQDKDALARLGRHLADLPAGDKVNPAGGFVHQEKQYETENTVLSTLDALYAQLVARHQLAELELQNPERVRDIQAASSPTQKDMRKQLLGTVFAGLMGYVLLALGVVAYETVGRRVSSLADLKGAGPAPVVGVIPCQPAEATGRDPLKRAAANEAVDKLRAYVAQTWLSRGATTVAVTSALGDEGKAFTAFGLATSLAQSGYKTLAVDFDLRDPALHTYAGVANGVGVCEALRGEADARAAVLSLPGGLDLLPAGKWTEEARKAAVGGRLEALIARLKEPYDCVVFHGDAILTVAESVEVARRCEVVLVCAQYRETKAPLLRKATDRVAAMEIPYSGVVYVGASDQEALC